MGRLFKKIFDCNKAFKNSLTQAWLSVIMSNHYVESTGKTHVTSLIPEEQIMG